MADDTNTAGSAQGPTFFGNVGTVLQRGDIMLALGLVAIITVLILPLATWMLDIMLALSFSLSVLVLMTVLFIPRPLDFSSFPSVLLMTTLLRLSLNLASTRLILQEGHTGSGAAGHVIEAFGRFMMGGNFVIGIIVFGILVIVNFVVITKGSGRIAEVAARFNLDAMPGKQMAIDADLSSGLINEDEAKFKRKELEQENSFFGAMDGAAKFVRGDAIAGLIITMINIVGGIIVGTAQMGLSLGEAAQSYTMLTVGDGLVSQIPALVVSIAAGMLVSKSSGTGSVDKALFSQLGGYPSALGLSSFLTGSMALLPGLPFLPFILLSAGSGTLAYFVHKRQTEAEQLVVAEQHKAASNLPAEIPISKALQLDVLRLELGYGLLTLVKGGKGQAKLTDQIKSLRRQLATEMGFVLPSVRIQDNLQLGGNSYVIRVKEIEAGRGDVNPNMLLVMDPKGGKIELAGEETVEPTFGLPAMWVGENLREESQFRGYTVVEPATVLTTHLTEIIKDYMSELLSYAETQKLLEDIGPDQQKLVKDIVPDQLSVGGVQRVLQNLLRERISVRDLPTILEGISEATQFTKSTLLITEHVRSLLARQISDSYIDGEGVIPLVTLSPEWEAAFAESLIGDSDEKQLSMAPSHLQDFINAVRKSYEQFAMKGQLPILLTSPMIRPYVRSVIERFSPATMVMSQNEIHAKVKIRTLGQI